MYGRVCLPPDSSPGEESAKHPWLAPGWNVLIYGANGSGVGMETLRQIRVSDEEIDRPPLIIRLSEGAVRERCLEDATPRDSVDPLA